MSNQAILVRAPHSPRAIAAANALWAEDGDLITAQPTHADMLACVRSLTDDADTFACLAILVSGYLTVTAL